MIRGELTGVRKRKTPTREAYSYEAKVINLFDPIPRCLVANEPRHETFLLVKLMCPYMVPLLVKLD